MANSQWKDVANSEDIEEGRLFSAELSEEESVLLIRRPEGLVAWADSCTHAGCPMSFGHLDKDTLICPCHNAQFDAATGKMLSPPALDDLPGYEVKEEHGRVFIGSRHEPEFPTPSGTDDRTVAIVGAGAAGAMAAEQLRREGFGGRIVMITPEDGRPYNRPLLSKFYLAKDMSFDNITLRPTSFYDTQRIELWNGRRATGVDPESKRISLDDGSELEADFIVLATGSRAKSIPVPGVDLDGCYLLREVADAEAIRTRAVSATNVVVVGASFIGTETAAYLRDRGLNVTVVAPESVPFETVFGERVGKRFAAMHNAAGIDLKLGTGVSRFVGTDHVESVELADGTVLPADLVVIGAGVEPVVDYLDGSGLVEDGAVPVDQFLRTRFPGVYAAGDIARVAGSDRAKRVEHWVVAQRHGQQAAKSIVGAETPLPYAPFFWTRQMETSFVYIGYAPDFDEIRYKGDVEEGKFLAGYFKDGVLAAVGTMGKGKSAIRFGRLLDEGRRITVEDFEAGLSKIGG